MSTIVPWFTTLGCRQKGELLAPEYAALLHRSYYDQFLKPAVLSRRVLFLGPVPSEARASVRLLRQVRACRLVISVAFFITLMLTVLMMVS
ncbi:hypothetical protein [Dyella sp. ASV21]|uniref:hypothetical protein n=1 Tax=Dyella sp. ASV21 TaxID=2795114 RepID=UPI0018EDE3BA|nr:hypothetical protein [Dyella sp. ASV21]